VHPVSVPGVPQNPIAAAFEQLLADQASLRVRASYCSDDLYLPDGIALVQTVQTQQQQQAQQGYEAG